MEFFNANIEERIHIFSLLWIMFLKINILSRKKLLITFRNWVLSILTKACYKRHATYRTLSLTLVRFHIQTEIQSMGEHVLSDWNLSYRHLGKVIMGRFVYLFDLQCCTLPVSGILCYSSSVEHPPIQWTVQMLVCGYEQRYW